MNTLPSPVEAVSVVAVPAWGLLMTIVVVVFLVSALISRGSAGAVVKMLLMGFGGMFLLFFVGLSSVRVHHSESATVSTPQYGGISAERMQTAVTHSGDEATVAEPEPAADLPVEDRIELFEGRRRTPERLEALPDWAANPEKNEDPNIAVIDSGQQPDQAACDHVLLVQLQGHLTARLHQQHPETRGWQPNLDEVKNSSAVQERVRQTQFVKIDVSSAVIREPLRREFWKVSLEPQVVDKLWAEWRPSASRQRTGILATGVGAVTLLMGAFAFALRRPKSPSEPTV
jgi:hypothetical protein